MNERRIRPELTMDDVISDIISATTSNIEQTSDQLTRIDKTFRAHMFRQIALEHEIEESLKHLKGSDNGRTNK